MHGGVARLNGGVGSQFLSALLIAAPLADADTKIVIEGDLKSRPYAEITLDMLDDAGVRVQAGRQEFFVQGNQTYNLKGYTVPGDFSSASYPLAAAAVTGSAVTVKGILPSWQGDAAIIDSLNCMGAKVSWDKEKGDLKIKGGELQGIEVDASLTPDLVPTIAVLGAVAKGKTIVKNAEHVRHKETDRLHAMAAELSKMGANIKERPDGLEILGRRASRGQHSWLPRPQNCDGADGCRPGGRRDANRYGGVGGCVLSWILRSDGGAGGEGAGGMKGRAIARLGRCSLRAYFRAINHDKV